MEFKKRTPTDMDVAIQRGMKATLDHVARGLINRRCATPDDMNVELYKGASVLCVVALNDSTSGLVLRSVSHTMGDSKIISFRLGDPDPDYTVGSLVIYSATKTRDGKLSEYTVPVDWHPLLVRLKEIVSNLVRRNINLLRAPLDLTVISDEGWERRRISLGTPSTETAEVNTIACAITTTLSNISNGVASSSYGSRQELHEAMMYDAVIVLAVVADNDRNGVVIRLLSHRFSDDYACTRCFSSCSDRELKVGDLVFHAIAPLAGGAVRETITTIKPPRERTSLDPAQYVEVANMWASYSALLTRIEAFFAALIKRGIDLKKVVFEPSLLGSNALEGGIVGRIDFNQSADA
jgi:hypothetical protein